MLSGNTLLKRLHLSQSMPAEESILKTSTNPLLVVNFGGIYAQQASKKYNNVQMILIKIAQCLLFSSLTALLSMINIPLPFTPIPINLALISVFISGSILGTKGGSISQFLYVLFRMLGIPFFALNINCGSKFLLGETGGYVIGYIFTAFITGFVLKKRKNHRYFNICKMIFGLFICYLFGTIWFVALTGTNFLKALMLCVVPFLVGDFIKIVVSEIIVSKYKTNFKR